MSPYFSCYLHPKLQFILASLDTYIFCMDLGVHYIYIHSKNYVSKKTKTNCNLGRREYMRSFISYYNKSTITRLFSSSMLLQIDLA